MAVQKTGTLISAVRKEKGLTQKQLAEQLHVSDRTISKWECGSGFPDISLLEPLADALDVSVTAYYKVNISLRQKQILRSATLLLLYINK